jgi:hypothetical protein
VRYARENDIPFLGICLGMHVALIEYARNVCGLEHAHSTEMVADTPHPIVALITEWMNPDGSTEQRDENSDLGGTMRLGAQPCHLSEGSRVREIYAAPVITERHRHRYEVNNNYVDNPRAARHGRCRLVRGPLPRGDDRAAGTLLVRRLPVPPGVHVAAAWRTPAVYQLHPGRLPARRGQARRR